MNPRKRVVLILTFALAVALILSRSIAQAQGPKDPKDIKLSWIGKTLNNPWWISVADFSVVEAQQLGVQLTIAMPEK